MKNQILLNIKINITPSQLNIKNHQQLATKHNTLNQNQKQQTTQTREKQNETWKPNPHSPNKQTINQ